MASQMEIKLQSTGFSSCEMLSLQHINCTHLKDSLCISLLELDAPFLADMSDHDFASLKTMIASLMASCGSLKDAVNFLRNPNQAS